MKKSKATEALRVVSEIAAIRAALKKRGYRIQKQPKQAAWKVYTPLNPSLLSGKTKALSSSRGNGETGKSYLLTEKWKHVLWVHIEGIGGYFISYRKLEQWVAACCTLIRSCRDLKALAVVWSAIEREAERYTEEALSRLSELHEQRLAQLCHP